MNLVLLYGPPASGKLTVGKAVSKLLKYPLMHNHLIADFAHTFFEYGTDAYVKFAQKLRMQAIDAAIAAAVPGMVMTFAYGLETKEGADDDQVLRLLRQRVLKTRGKIFFVRLTASHAVLCSRVGLPDRQQHHKLAKVKILKHLLKNYAVERVAPFEESLTIETDQLSPQKAAKKIAAWVAEHT